MDEAVPEAPEVVDVPLALALSARREPDAPPPQAAPAAGTRSDELSVVEPVVTSEFGAETVPKAAESKPELGGTAVVPLDGWAGVDGGSTAPGGRAGRPLMLEAPVARSNSQQLGQQGMRRARGRTLAGCS